MTTSHLPFKRSFSNVDWAAFGVIVADGLTAPFWVLGDLYLWRKQPLGYVSGAGLLLQASMLFAGLLVFFILQLFVAGVPFPVMDFIVILAMGWSFLSRSVCSPGASGLVNRQVLRLSAGGSRENLRRV